MMNANSAMREIERAFSAAGEGLRPNERKLATDIGVQASWAAAEAIRRAQDRGLPFLLAVDKTKALRRAVEQLAYMMVADCIRESVRENVTMQTPYREKRND